VGFESKVAARDSRLTVHGLRLATRGSLLVTALVIAPSAHGASMAQAAPSSPSTAACESLTALSFPNATITIAQSVPAGSFTTPFNQTLINLPAFCRIAATLKPSSDSTIKIEVWLPTSSPRVALPAAPQGGSGWNGKLLAVGNGGWAGSIPYPALANALRRGYAATATDTGHEGNGGSFALGHPERLVDYAYRSEHEMTVAAKVIVGAFYGTTPSRSYWNGCSTGGRQALVEATRYPDDFDGIIAGAAANPKTLLDAWRMWMAQVAMKDQADRILPSQYSLIHRAVLAQCDAIDGVKDGLIEDPLKCRFDPKAIVCKSTDDLSGEATCLTPRQALSARALLGGVKTPKGKEIFPGYAPGSELGWGLLMGGPEPYSVPLDQYRYIVFNDPKWDWRTFDLERDLAAAEKAGAGTLSAVSTDLSAFTQHGGKLLMYHGWADQDVPPLASINFYNSVQPKSAQESVRLFMVPGMNHCTGGEGPNTFDVVAALEQWVEHQKAPTRILASHANVADGKIDRTRPLCAYPQTAHYRGRGNINDAENFVCGK
jgi:feruloyl esterase